MKLQLKPEQGGILVSAKDALPPDGRDYGEHMLLAAAVLEQVYREARFVAENELLPSFVVTGWIARKAARNTVIGIEPSPDLRRTWEELEQASGQQFEPAVRTINGLGRMTFLRRVRRPSRSVRPR